MRTCLTLWTLTLATLAGAQYRPLPTANAHWIEQHAWLNCCGTGSNYVTCTRRIHFGTDTVMNGHTYQELRTEGICQVQYISDPWPPYDYTETDERLAFIRQDTAARRVFAWDPWSAADTLVYDFNLGVGPYPATYINQYPDLAVTAVDSVQLADGWHRRWKLNVTGFSDDTAAVIEGIGSTYGVFGPMWPPFEWTDDLKCFSNDSMVIYTWPNGDPGEDCSFAMEARPPVPMSPTLGASPNPFSDHIILSGNTGRNMVRFQLFTAAGSLLLEGRTNGTIAVPPAVPKGLYLLALFDAGARPLAMLRMVKDQAP